jgi:predicted MFS family arabinose efflux permease
VAALFFIPLGVMTALGNLGSGLILDRASPLKVMAIQLGLFTAILMTLPFAASSAAVWLYGLAFGTVQGIQGAVLGSSYARYYGRPHLGTIKGYVKTIFVAGTAIGPVVYAIGPDLLGSVQATLWVAALVPLVLATVAWRALEP